MRRSLCPGFQPARLIARSQDGRRRCQASAREEVGLQVAADNHYAASVTRGLGREGVVRASFAHTNSLADVDRLIAALMRLDA